MATTHNFSVFANCLVRPPIDPKTGLAATLDERSVNQQPYRNHSVGKYDDSAPVAEERSYSRARSEQLAPPRDDSGAYFADAGDVTDGFFDVLTKLKEENKKNLEITERLYQQKQAECDQMPEPTRGLQSSVENLSNPHKSVKLNDQQLKNNKEMVQRIIAAGIKNSGFGTASSKPPSGKAKTSDGLPAKSGATLTKSHSRTWSDRVRASEPYWKAPQSRASSDFDINEVERYKDYLISLSQSAIIRPADDIWDSYSFTADHEPQSHVKTKGRLVRSSSMSRLPTSKNDVLDSGVVDTWKNRVTVPQPFSMTLREANRSPRKTRVAIEVEQKKVAKQLEEELECQKKFKATPLPAHIFVPMFQEIMEGQESKRRMIHENGEELLKSLQDPFEFVLREEEKVSQRRTRSASANGRISSAKFKANPFPSHIFDDSVSARMAEEEEYRRIRAKFRAKELMKSARLPSSMDERDKDYFAGRSRQRERAKKASKMSLVVEPSFRPKINKSMPDFDERYKKFLASVTKKQVQQTTVSKPFKLETSKLAVKKRRTLEEDAKLWETTKENGSSQKGKLSRPLSKFITGILSTPIDSIPAKMTHASELRTSLTKLKQQKVEEKQMAEVRDKQQKMLKEKVLKQMVATRSAAVDTSIHSMDRNEILKSKIEAEKERSASYRKQLHEMKKRLQERPLLFEQIAEKNARMAAERKYYATLSKSGLNVEYLSKKSSSDVAVSVSAHEAEDLGLHDDQFRDQSPGSPQKEDSPPVSDRRSALGSRPSSGRMSERSVAKSVEEEEVKDDETEEEYADDFGGSEEQSDGDDDEEKDDELVEEL